LKDDWNCEVQRAAVAASRIAYWRAVRDRVVNLEAISAEFPERRP
jgi:hypothetical protein